MVVVGAVERTRIHSHVAAAVGTLADIAVHNNLSRRVEMENRREALALLGGESVKKDFLFLKQFRDFGIRHIPVSEDRVHEETAFGRIACIVHTSVSLCSLHHIAAAEGALPDSFLFHILKIKR